MDIKRIIFTDSVFTNTALQKGLKLLLFFDNLQPIYCFAVIKESSEKEIKTLVMTHLINLPIYVFTNNNEFLKITNNFPFSLPRYPNYIPEKDDLILLKNKDDKWYEILILDIKKEIKTAI